jgi:hypothetical protein
MNGSIRWVLFSILSFGFLTSPAAAHSHKESVLTAQAPEVDLTVKVKGNVTESDWYLGPPLSLEKPTTDKGLTIWWKCGDDHFDSIKLQVIGIYSNHINLEFLVQCNENDGIKSAQFVDTEGELRIEYPGSAQLCIVDEQNPAVKTCMHDINSVTGWDTGVLS